MTTFFYVMVIKSDKADFDISDVINDVAKAVMGRGAEIVTVVPDPIRAEDSKPKPLYRVRVTKQSIKRDEQNNQVGLAVPGEEYSVYRELPKTGEWINRIVISLPGDPIVHIYKVNTEKVT